jgi:RNA polymerase sigma-70 factor, ECF subfamily
MSAADPVDPFDPFDAERPRLVGLAYRMLGSMSDAEDVAQDAWLRWRRADQSTIDRPAAWLTTVTTRLALDRLRAAQRERERYVGPWLPQPVVTHDDPEASAELAESLTLGFLVMLERLQPEERAVLLLADVFGEPYAAVAAAVGKSEAACRQIAHRARQRVRATHAVTPRPQQRAVAARFAAALVAGDIDELLAVLSPGVQLVSDGGADHHAARRPVVGPDRVARFLTNISRRTAGSTTVHEVELNGEPGFVAWRGHRAVMAVVLEVDGDRIAAVRVVVNPDKLAALAPLSGP